MRIILCFVLAMFYSAITIAQTPMCPPLEFWMKVFIPESEVSCTDYEPAFEEIFDGDALDITKWDAYFPCYPAGDDDCFSSRLKDHNAEDPGASPNNGIIRDQNVEVNNGTCKLKITSPPGNNNWKGIPRDFNVGHIQTKDAFNFAFYEARIRTPIHEHYWEAFWLWNFDEIDIMEFADHTDYLSNVYPAIDSCDDTNHVIRDVVGEFHTFKMEFTPFKISFFLDEITTPQHVVFRYYKEEENGAMTAMDFECGSSIPEGIYRVNPEFPELYQRYYNPLFDNTVYEDAVEEPFNVANTIMEIDEVKVLERSTNVCGGLQYEAVEADCPFTQRCFSVLPMGDNSNKIEIIASSSTANIDHNLDFSSSNQNLGKICFIQNSLEPGTISFSWKDECNPAQNNSITVPIPRASSNCDCEIRIEEDRTIDYFDVALSSLRIGEEVTLTLRNSELTFTDGGEIYLDERAKLILDNTTIGACNEQWQGIITNKDAHGVTLINASSIKDAAIGIQLRPLPWFDPLVVHENAEHPKLIMENSFIEDCEVGVQFGYGFSDSEINSFSIFRNNNVGIIYANHTGLKLDRTYFFENTEGIRSVDGYMHVRDGNAFHGGEIGISVEGTLPLGGGIDIGDMGEGWNLFASDVKDAIRCNGAEHAAGANIVNCQFKNVQESATVFEGANQYLFANNTVELSTNGMVAIAAGDNINESKCNEFEDLNNIGIYYENDNSQSQFLENYFIGQQDENVIIDNATMRNKVGEENNPATNCFSSQGLDIVTLNNSTNFEYYFYAAQNAPICEEPVNDGVYEKIESPIEGDHCQGNIGIFGLISPGGNGTTGFDPHTVRSTNYAGHISKETLNGFIENQITQVIAAGGDDPRTYDIESSAFQADDLGVKEKVLDQWIRYAIYRGIEQKDYGYVETLLTPLKQWRWQTRLYGVKVLRGNFLGAQQFLQGLPTNREEEIHFQGVQQINLRRLLSGSKGNAITQADTDYLLTVATLPYASSGYAHSLYRILTGIKLPYNLPEAVPMPKLALEEVQVIQSLEKILTVYPNPFQHSFTLQLSNAQLNLVSLYNSNGQWLRGIPCQSNKIQLEFKEYPAGLYFLKVYDDTGKQYIQKLVKE